MKYLRPIPLQDRYYLYIRQEIERLWNELIYIPLFRASEIKKVELKNEVNDPLYRAIEEGLVWYEDGRLFGTFNAAITRRIKQIGGIFNSASNTFSIAELPPEYLIAQGMAAIHYDNLRRKLLKTLDDMNIASIDRLSEIPDKYMQTIEWMEGDFQKAVRGILVPPILTEDQKGILASEWGMNLDLYIKEWAQENILKLRQQIQTNAFAGRRASSLVKSIMDNYQVSKRKAEFLARQETSLLMSKFHQERYKSAGVTRYKWSGTMDERERHDHKILEGQIFFFDQPPVVDRKSGRRANPGEDFGCRCVAVPILDEG